MSKLVMIVAAAVALLLGGGAVYLMTADIPAPSQNVKKTLNNDRFPS